MADEDYSAVKDLSDPETNIVESLADLEIPDTEVKEVRNGILVYLSNLLGDAIYARNAKVDTELIEFLNIRRGRYDESRLQQIKREEPGSTYYDSIGRVKCRAGIALIEDVLSPSDGKPWTIQPTPIPDLPEDLKEQVVQNILNRADIALSKSNAMTEAEREEINQQIFDATAEAHDRALDLEREKAKEMADRMERVIHDQMVEGGYDEAFAEFISNLVTFHSAFLKGPLPRKVKTIAHKRVDGEYKQTVEEIDKLTFEAPNPMDIYPSPDQVGIDDGYFFERMYLDRKYLTKCKGVEGYDDQAIDRVLDIYGDKGLQVRLTTDEQRNRAENKDFKEGLESSDKIEVYEFWGSVQGKHLKEIGIDTHDDKPIEDLDELEITAWITADRKEILRCVLNPDALGRRPYQMTSYMKVPNAFWGECVPSLMKESQRFCNKLYRSIENNIAIASGPQVIVNDVGRIAEGEELTAIEPWKIWQGQAPHPNAQSQSSADFIRFEQPALHVSEMKSIYNDRLSRADEETGIPSYSHGSPELAGAGGTARGLSMLMASSSKIIKQVIRNIDTVNEALIARMYEWNMLHNDDETIKGDVNIVPQGALSLIVKEQTQVRLNELLAITNNPTDNQIIDIVHRGRILREVVKDLDLPANDIIPTEEELQKIQSGALQQEVIQQLAQENPVIGMILSGELDTETIMAMMEGQAQGEAMMAQEEQAQAPQGPAPATGTGMQENDSGEVADLGEFYQ